MKGVGEGICVCVCQREGDSLIPSFACPSFISGPCLSGVLCAYPGVPASCPLPAQMPRGPTPHPENYFADCSTGRTMISREILLVKSD